MLLDCERRHRTGNHRQKSDVESVNDERVDGVSPNSGPEVEHLGKGATSSSANLPSRSPLVARIGRSRATRPRDTDGAIVQTFAEGRDVVACSAPPIR